MTPHDATPTVRASQHAADAELVGRVGHGDAKAARLLVEDNLASVLRFAQRMLRDPDEAQDVAQETFLRLWREASRWEPRARLRTWLFRVAHNLCVDRLRSGRTAPLSQSPEQADPRPEAPALLAEHEQARAVAEAISSLPERQRAALVLVYHEGLSNREAAEILGVEIDALESLLARARQSLRKRLGEAARSDETS